jgi:hypothetical protein
VSATFLTDFPGVYAQDALKALALITNVDLFPQGFEIGPRMVRVSVANFHCFLHINKHSDGPPEALQYWNRDLYLTSTVNTKPPSTSTHLQSMESPDVVTGSPNSPKSSHQTCRESSVPTSEDSNVDKVLHDLCSPQK